MVLRYPYPNDVYEPSSYMDVTRQTELKGEDLNSPDFHVCYKVLCIIT